MCRRRGVFLVVRAALASIAAVAGDLEAAAVAGTPCSYEGAGRAGCAPEKRQLRGELRPASTASAQQDAKRPGTSSGGFDMHDAVAVSSNAAEFTTAVELSQFTTIVCFGNYSKNAGNVTQPTSVTCVAVQVDIIDSGMRRLTTGRHLVVPVDSLLTVSLTALSATAAVLCQWGSHALCCSLNHNNRALIKGPDLIIHPGPVPLLSVTKMSTVAVPTSGAGIVCFEGSAKAMPRVGLCATFVLQGGVLSKGDDIAVNLGMRAGHLWKGGHVFSRTTAVFCEDGSTNLNYGGACFVLVRQGTSLTKGPDVRLSSSEAPGIVLTRLSDSGGVACMGAFCRGLSIDGVDLTLGPGFKLAEDIPPNLLPQPRVERFSDTSGTICLSGFGEVGYKCLCMPVELSGHTLVRGPDLVLDSTETWDVRVKKYTVDIGVACYYASFPRSPNAWEGQICNVLGLSDNTLSMGKDITIFDVDSTYAHAWPIRVHCRGYAANVTCAVVPAMQF